MEGSSSGGKRSGDGLPPIGRRSNRRRPSEENTNIADNNGEDGLEIAAAEAEHNLQPQPQQVGGGEMVPAADNVDNSRLANRRYSEAYRHRKQNHLLLLQTRQENLEAEIAQSTALIDNYSIQKSMLQEENALLKQQLEAASANVLYKEGETEQIKAEIERMKKRNEDEQQQILSTMSNPSFFELQAAYMDTLAGALGHLVPFPSDQGMNVDPPTDDDFGVGGSGLGPFGQNPPNDPHQAGPSGEKDPHY